MNGDMEANEYQELALRTAAPVPDMRRQLIAAALGLCGESGEFADMLKKAEFHGHALDQEALRKELGDVLWYVALACDALELQMADVMEANIAKLRLRYPDGFSQERSRNREM
jgi:NTP pyrophosphatase (non-canonical NTP hydrolase)